jgi:hypothetical protein
MAPQPYDPTVGPVWKVTNTQTTTGADATGRYVPGYQLTYQLKSGLSGTVFLPKANYSKDAATAAIMADAAQLAEVSNLSSGM